MPVKPENAKRYPRNWKDLVKRVRERAGNCCEGSPAYPDCRARNYHPHPTTGSSVVLTTGHLSHDDLETQDISRLRYWCQRCHLRYDHEHHLQTAYETRREGKAVQDMFE